MEALNSEINIRGELVEVTSFALQKNNIPIIREIAIQNLSDSPVENTLLCIHSDQNILSYYERKISCLPGRQTIVFHDISLALQDDAVLQLANAVKVNLYITLWHKETKLCSMNTEVTVLSYNEWHGSLYFPEMLASFVMPGHPKVTKILQRATEILGNCTEHPVLGYESRDFYNVSKQAQAIYTALQEQNISRTPPPKNFDTVGQSIRLYDTILEQHTGTCLDLALFYAGCLEAAGLNPLLFIKKNHIFAGVWLRRTCFSEPIQKKTAMITKRLSSGTGEIAAVECTAFTLGSKVSFSEAQQIAFWHLQGADSIEYIIDIRQARKCKIQPLPLRVKSSTGYKIAPVISKETFHEEESGSPSQEWRHTLLAIDSRNQLPNLQNTDNIVPILVSSVQQLADALLSNKTFSIIAKPSVWPKEEKISYFDTTVKTPAISSLVQSEIQNGRLCSALLEEELLRSVSLIYQNENAALEERGATTTYLAFGLLRWYETEESESSHYAPLLFLPVKLAKAENENQYCISFYSESLQVNYSLLELLKQDFGISADGISSVSMSDGKMDLSVFLAAWRRAIAAQSRFEIIESVFLGNFALSRFMIYNDLLHFKESFQKIPLVDALINANPLESSGKEETEQEIREEELILPLPLNRAQLQAVAWSDREKSFLLNGPPGTGKTQSLAAIIANAIGKGKRVLFVSEKEAAHSALLRRMDAIGLMDFCLPVSKREPFCSKELLLHLQRHLFEEPTGNRIPYSEKAKETALIHQRLSEYSLILSRTRPLGLSLFDMINRYVENAEAETEISCDKESIKSLSKSSFLRQEALLERLVAAAKGVGHPYNHPLRWVLTSQYSPRLLTKLPAALFEYRKAIEDVVKAKARLSSYLGIPDDDTRASWEHLSMLADALHLWNGLPRIWTQEEQLSLLKEHLPHLDRHIKRADKARKLLLKDWKPEFLEQDGVLLKASWETTNTKWAVGKWLSQEKLIKTLTPYSITGVVTKSKLFDTFSLLIDYQKEKTAADEELAHCKSALSPLCSNEKNNRESILILVKTAELSITRLKELTGNEVFCKQFAALPETNQHTGRFIKSLRRFKETEQDINSLLTLLEPEDETNYMQTRILRCTDISNGSATLREWTLWKALCKEAEQAGLSPVIKAYENGCEHDKIAARWHKSFYHTCIQAVLEEEPGLSAVSGEKFEEDIEQLKQLLRERSRLAKQKIREEISVSIANTISRSPDSPEIAWLKNYIPETGAEISTYELFQELPSLLFTLCPCVLMSPATVAQYLNRQPHTFDLVLFDESSQILGCKAYGAIARAKAVVIAGDPCQIPPIDPFKDAIDQEFSEGKEVESIWSEAEKICLPEIPLTKHYRSQDESLFLFNNSRFYHNRIFTYPSVNKHKMNVQFVPVPLQYGWGKSEQNDVEAKAIITEILRRFHDPVLKPLSIGVITLEKEQQKRIYNLFSELCKINALFKNWAYGKEEALFIKNVDDVQGEERDIILLSVGCEIVQKGRSAADYQPLGGFGGWQMLNVAVSRARMDMLVYSALTDDQINLSKTNSEGAAALKSFLRFAHTNQLELKEKDYLANRPKNLGILEQIRNALVNEGYESQEYVGASNSHIDIAVINPRNPEKYLLGILLDSITSHTIEAADSSEIEYALLLEKHGWQIHRIWSIDWWRDSKLEIEKLLTRIRQTLSGEKITSSIEPIIMTESSSLQTAKETEETPAKEFIEIEKDDSSSPAPLPVKKPEPAAELEMNLETAKRGIPYQIAELPLASISAEEYALPRSEKIVRQRILSVLSVEAPISEQLLTKRLLQSFGISRAGSRIQAQNERILSDLKLPVTIQEGRKFYWRKDQAPEKYEFYRISGSGDRKRDIREIPCQEIVNTAVAVLALSDGQNKEELLREITKTLGYARITPPIAQALENGLDFALQTNQLFCQDNRYSLS